MNIQNLFEEFIMESEYARKLRPETIRGYREVFELFCRLTPDLSLDTLNTTTVVYFFKTLNERKRVVGKIVTNTGVKKSTVATYWSKLNAFCSWLYTKGHIALNPFSQMKYPQPTYEDKKYLKKEEIEKIFTAVHLHYNNDLLILKRNVLLFNILLFCGLRREELLLLQVRDIDIERRLLSVRSETSKSGTSRNVPLTANLIVLIKDYLACRASYSTPYLFVSSHSDKQLGYDGVKHLVKKLNKASGVRFHLHQFRHTFAVNFLKQSKNLFSLKEILGHKDIRMTALYLRQLPIDEMRIEVEKMSISELI